MDIIKTKTLSDPYTRWFLYGASGAGKTQAASTFPVPLFIVPRSENSHVTLMGRDFDVVLIEDRASLVRVIQELEERVERAQDLWARDTDDAIARADEIFPWQTIVVESLSHYCEMLVEDISRGGAKRMDQQQWGLLSSHLRNVHQRLSLLPVHVVYTALDAAGTEDTAGKPLMTGKNATIIPSACDVIGYCECATSKRGTVYRVHFREFQRNIARSRFPGLPERVVNFDFAELEKTLHEASTETTD